ncbi:CbrC family protein [Variovorax sp. RB3P1]|uniref:CbrC family protein n=1 Tax=Variovorax sp. RB3P1 TaxID=3443732 RepID=UPI003F474B52
MGDVEHRARRGLSQQQFQQPGGGSRLNRRPHNDTCEFHGDVSVEDVANATDATKAHWLATYDQVEEGWNRTTTGYQCGGDSALYKFVCRHCNQILFAWDLS